MSPPLLEFITFGVSHYCEKARWALDRSGLTYTEAKHFPLLHFFFVGKLGGQKTSLPKLIIENHEERMVLHESTDILHYANKLITFEDEQLYPSGLEETIEAWEGKFDNVLGPHVRRWVYCYLLYHKGAFGMIGQGSSFVEKTIGFLLLPLIKLMLYRSLGCNKPNAKEISFGKIAGIFKEVDVALADGRPFICGKTFTAADLAFAALGGPVLCPTGYGNQLPSIEQCPQEMAEKINMLRETNAGKHVLQLYETQRHHVVPRDMLATF